MKIALAQILSTDNVQRNLELVAEYSQQAAGAGARCVVFPEAAMICFGGRLHKDAVESASTWNAGLEKVAADTGITIIAGSFVPEPDTDPEKPRVYNQLRVVKPTGTAEVYTKIHLYDAFDFKESDGVAEGDDIVITEIDGVKVGLSICYDVRFPKLYAELSRAGAEVIVVPASWAGGSGKVQQWQALTTARALDSNSFVVAVDQADPRSSNPDVDVTEPLGVGYSRVVSPFGAVVVEAAEEQELLVADIDLDLVKQAKKALPVLKNAKLGY